VRDSDGGRRRVDGRHARRGKRDGLLVEDNDVVRGLVQTILVERGYNVLVADGPSGAIGIADAYPEAIHLLVTDVVMPEMNGRELAEHLLVERPDMRALYMSGYTNDVMIARGVLPAGMLFLQKPFTATQLGATARRALAGA
jgi:two-component system, cell cycle sensor histidine kinase and response regulator CckA